MRRELLIVLLFLLAGCSGVNGGASPTQTTDTESPVQTTIVRTEDTAPTDATPTNTIDYTELTAAEKEAFNAAREGDVGYAPKSIRKSPYIDQTYYPVKTGDIFQNNKYVRKDDSYFRVSWGHGPTIATYGIRTTEQQPPENATVVGVENLSSQVQEPVQKAIENGSYGTPPGKWDTLPEELDEIDYVCDGEAYYKISIVVGDYWPDVMSVEPVM
jgi:hypothetical protein